MQNSLNKPARRPAIQGGFMRRIPANAHQFLSKITEGDRGISLMSIDVQSV
jgi:hypothetical protein